MFRPYHPELQKDPRTLLKTKKQYDIFDLAGGQYPHFGLLNCVISRVNKMVMCLPDDFCFNRPIVLIQKYTASILAHTWKSSQY